MPSYRTFTSYEINGDPERETWNTIMGNFTGSAANAELYAYKYTDPSLSDTSSLVRIEAVGLHSELRMLGVEFHEPTSTLFVIKHRRRVPRIEQFRLNLETLIATHLHSLSHPLIRRPDSVITLGDACGIMGEQVDL
ncbi:hypothetical protein F4775DRAFT_591327 [Biscogniauxia sp. FL1348]|nr:hypothetical protein F4775DRAFT_591327 [Biscogniauxia sp. FL1348]